jgi:hypothetical protein
MGEVAGLVAALAACAAVFFAWRTVIETRLARDEGERARRLASLGALGAALTELADQSGNGALGLARLTQARARVLWLTSDVPLALEETLVPALTTSNLGLIEARATNAVEVLLTGLDDYLAQHPPHRRQVGLVARLRIRPEGMSVWRGWLFRPRG